MRRKLAPAVTGEARATHCISYDRRSLPHTLALSHCFDSGSVSYYVGSCIVRADATGQPLDKIEEDTDRDFFMTVHLGCMYVLGCMCVSTYAFRGIPCL